MAKTAVKGRDRASVDSMSIVKGRRQSKQVGSGVVGQRKRKGIGTEGKGGDAGFDFRVFIYLIYTPSCLFVTQE